MLCLKIEFLGPLSTVSHKVFQFEKNKMAHQVFDPLSHESMMYFTDDTLQKSWNSQERTLNIYKQIFYRFQPPV